MKIKDKYWFCLLPACDAERIKEDGFPFPFARVNECVDGKKADVVVNVVGAPDGIAVPHSFSVAKGWEDLCQIKFRPAVPGGPVIAQRNSPDAPWTFEVCAGTLEVCAGTPATFIGAVRPLIAQQIVDRFANHGARIGLMESEYHRRLRSG